MAQINCLAKLGLFRISRVMGSSQAGKSYEFFSLERSFKNEKDEWENERIILRPAEMCSVADMLKLSARRIMVAQAKADNARMQQNAEAGNASADDNISDDVPF